MYFQESQERSQLLLLCLSFHPAQQCWVNTCLFELNTLGGKVSSGWKHGSSNTPNISGFIVTLAIQTLSIDRWNLSKETQWIRNGSRIELDPWELHSDAVIKKKKKKRKPQNIYSKTKTLSVSPPLLLFGGGVEKEQKNHWWNPSTLGTDGMLYLEPFRI